MKFIWVLLIIVLFATSSFAEDTNSTSNGCTGNWVLLNESGWYVRNENGIILPLSSSTIVLGCANTPIKLYSELIGASVEIICTPSNLDFGLPNVTSITLVCK